MPLVPPQEPVDPAPIPLGYATPDADGLPSFDPEAERMIDAGATPHHLRKRFRKGRLAARYYAKSMARRFGPWEAADVCWLCGQTPAPQLARTAWVVDVPAHAFEFRISSSDNRLPCTLYFPLCDGCTRAWAARIDRFAWLSVLAAWMQIGAFVTWMIVLVLWRLSSRFGGLAVVIALALLVAGRFVAFVSNAVVRRFVTPADVRRPGNRRFQFVGLDEIIDRRDIARVADDAAAID